jgi:hypothetical protein
MVENRTWGGYFSQLLDLVWKQHEGSSRVVESAVLIFQFSEDRTRLASILRKRLEKSPVETIGHGVLALAASLWGLSPEDSGGFVIAVIDFAMQWAVRRLTDSSRVSESDNMLCEELGLLSTLSFVSPTDCRSTQVVSLSERRT